MIEHCIDEKTENKNTYNIAYCKIHGLSKLSFMPQRGYLRTQLCHIPLKYSYLLMACNSKATFLKRRDDSTW